MSLHDEPRGGTPTAAEINAQIRDLWAHADGRRLTESQRQEYARLVTLWATVTRGEVSEAA